MVLKSSGLIFLDVNLLIARIVLGIFLFAIAVFIKQDVAYADFTKEVFASSVNETCSRNWVDISNSLGQPDSVYATVLNKTPVCNWNFDTSFNIPAGSKINNIKAKVYNSSSGNRGNSSMSTFYQDIQTCVPPPFWPATIYDGAHEYIVTPTNCPTTFPTIEQLNSSHINWRFFNSGNVTVFMDAISLQVDYTPPAFTTPYRPAGWVYSDGVVPYSSITGCQASNDGLYCSHSITNSGSYLYFGSFGDLEQFGIPINSSIDKIHIRVKGRNNNTQYARVNTGYNNKFWSYLCFQTQSELWPINLGQSDNTVEKHTDITSVSGMNKCITPNNINYRNLTFVLANAYNSTWSADIDNFEIAFDYTPPSVRPTPVSFPDNQKGTLWEIGPDKSNISKKSGLDNIVSVATGEQFSIALKSDGTVWTWTNSSIIPQQVKGENGVGILSDIKKIAAGGNYGLALKKDGRVWQWSQGNNGPDNPTLPKITNIIDIAAGGGHRLALKSDGTVWGWGQNNSGQIGIGCFLYNCSYIYNPNQTNNLSNVASIIAGGSHSLALKKDGTVWGWGSSREWALGESVLNMNNGLPERSMPVQIPELSNIKAISSRGSYNLAITNDDRVLEWGGEYSLRNPREIISIDNPMIISAGRSGYSYGVTGHIVKSDGTLWQLYINDISPKQVPILKNVTAVSTGIQTPSLALINSPGEVLGDSTVAPFLDLPFDYVGVGKTFEQVAFNPESWFDHKYPLQNFDCCIFKVLKYTGGKDADDAYRSHSGYDYAASNGVVFGTPVLAAASGSATFKPASKSGGAGNMIKIGHGSGYQTWYEHLDSNDLIINSEDATVTVNKGQKIGKVGMTGRTNGPHIHFSVFKDINNNGDFDDDYPYGMTDPLGWEPQKNEKDRTTDPWTLYGNGSFHGAASYQLFTAQAKPVMQAASRSNGGTVQTVDGNIKVSIPSDASVSDLTIKIQHGPFESLSKTVKSVVPSFYLTATNSLGDEVKNFLKTIRIVYKYATSDLVLYREGTLKMYNHNPDTEKWEEVPSTVDTEKKEITAETTHFSHFAVMGELKDIIAPVTDVKIIGENGQDNWYRSDVAVALNGLDNDEGLGLEYILYAVDNDTWKEYASSLEFNNEGDYKIYYQSFDKAGNSEDRKSVSFQIDKTLPNTSASASGTKGDGGWFTSDVSVALTATDSASGVAKTEYSLDDGESYQNYEDEIAVGKEGISEFLYRSVDKAGNVENGKKLTIKIDKTPPSSLVYKSGLRGVDNWYRSDVEIGINGNDDISGYQTSYYSLDDGENYTEVTDVIMLEDEGEHKIYYYSVDEAGNQEEKKSFVVKIDKTAPIVTISAAPDLLWPPNGKMVNVRVTGDVQEDHADKTMFKVADEYGMVEPVLSGFNQIIKLEAKRNGNDSDGRIYLIESSAEDFAGNKASAETKVIVPRDLRN